jgi:hypothetical protein
MPESTANSRISLILLATLAISGAALGWNKGRLPERTAAPRVGCVESALADETHHQQIAPDLALYRDLVADVRKGGNYYDAARQRIPQYDFPIASPLNWRLPTYAWLFALLPETAWIQVALVALSIAALTLAFAAHRQTSGIGYAALTTLLLVGVVRWSLDGQAYLAQEPWAATLIVLSLAAHALGARWRSLAIAAGITAHFFR